MKKFFSTNVKLKLFALLLVAGGLFAFTAMNNSTSAADCSSDAVITCGVTSVDDLRQKYKTDYTKGTKNIFSYFGINETILNTYDVKKGKVQRNGDVYVGSKLVAKNAITAGRENVTGTSTKRTVNGTVFYTHPMSVFIPPSMEIFAFFDNSGKFVAAVMLDCGNPVKADAVEPPKPAPVYTCASLSRIQKDRDTFVLRGKAKVENGAVLKGFTYNYGDGSTKYVAYTGHSSDSTTYKYVDSEKTYAKPGTYNVKITAHFTVNSKSVTKTSADCQKPVTIEDEPKKEMVKACNVETGEIVMVEKGQENKAPYTTDLTQCDDVKVCNPETGEIITVKVADEDKYLPVDAEECKDEPAPAPEKEVEVCNPETGAIITVKESEADKYLPVDAEECKDEPAVEGAVTEIPATGLADTLGSVMGVGALTTAIYYYVNSRRSLL